MNTLTYEHFRDFSQKTYLTEVEQNNCTLHCHRNLEILYLESGEMTGEINNIKYNYTADDIIFVPSYNSHVFKTPEYSKVIIFVIPYEFTTDFSSFLNRNTIDYTLSDKAFNRTLLSFLKLLLSLEEQSRDGYVIKGISITILGFILSHYKTTPINQTSNKYLIINVLNYIEKNFNQPLSLAILAEKFNYNKDYFSKLFNKSVGLSLNSYINSTRVEHVMKMLAENDYDDILTIIFECGFDSSSTFYRAFKTLYGKSPKTFLTNLKDTKISR